MGEIERDGLEIAAGLATVEAAPQLVAATKEVFSQSGFGKEVASGKLGVVGERAIEVAQGLAPALGVLALTYVGLRTMFRGLTDDPKRRRRS